ncbi:MAG: SCO6745 family protein [Mycobacteriaceae bacterium]
MDAHSAGNAARSLELLHSLIYFAPEAHERYREAGLDPGPMGYFASRAAALGAVTAPVVTATFYSFNPQVVSVFIPRAWELASPEKVLKARYAAVDDVYRRIFGDHVINSSLMAEAAELASVAARAIPGTDGRPLYLSHSGLSWPEPPHLVLWHALTLLREFRGDGHISVLQVCGLSGLDALITHTATGIGFSEDSAKSRRGWSAADWDTAVVGLQERGLIDAMGGLTEAGSALRAQVEDRTEELAFAPWLALGAVGVARLEELGKPWVHTVKKAGAFPNGLFGLRYGSTR